MLNRLWSFFTGYLTLIVEGRGLEKLINMAVGRGLYVWDVKWVDAGKARVKIRLNGFRALRHIARITSCRFRIAGKGGLPFQIAKLKKRKMLLAGAVLSMVLVYLMSSFIWFVEVRGNKNISADRVLRTAGEAGLAMGTVKIGLDKDNIARYIRNEIPEMAWVGVKIEGTRAVIEIAEKILVAPTDNTPANVVAKKDGLVQELLVLTGKGAVAEGTVVKKGDILISGIITPETKKTDEQQVGEKPKENTPPELIRFVRARGIVRAKTWYEGYGECRLIDQGKRRSGRNTEVLSLKLLDKELILKGPKSPVYSDFIISTTVKRLPVWRNLRIPVELITTNYYEVRRYRDIIGISDAKSLARKRALESARTKIPANSRITGELSEEIPDLGSNVIRVKAVIEALEEIGRVEPLKP